MKIFTLFIFGCASGIFAQTNVSLSLQWMAANEPVVLNQVFTNQSGNATLVNRFDMYISNFVVVHDGGIETTRDSVFLSSQNQNEFYLGMLNLNTIENLKFSIGVPQNLNHTDISEYKLSHPLGFKTPPMHWGWVSGYFFCCINGKVDTNSDGVPETDFELNSFGDANYTNVTTNPKVLTNADGSKTMYLGVHLDQWLKNLPLSTLGEAHGEFGVNITHMQNANTFPVFQNLQNASINSEKPEPLGCAFGCNATNNGFDFTWKDNVDKKLNVSLIDATGKTVFEQVISDFNGVSSIAIGAGVYYLKVANDKSILHARKVVRN